MVRCSIGWSGILYWLRDGFNHLGLGIGPINLIPTVSNLISNNLNHHVAPFRSRVTSLGRRQHIRGFWLNPKACRARPRAASVIEIESLGYSEFESSQPPWHLLLPLQGGRDPPQRPTGSGRRARASHSRAADGLKQATDHPLPLHHYTKIPSDVRC